ncbi:MAG: lipoyl synthase [Candidatus Aminicenantes bacterium]|nr:lipoyl synthase [Candidatus Aminicenantes bacterium]
MSEPAVKIKKPVWLKASIPSGDDYFHLKNKLAEKGLPTICQSARCPNIAECWNHNQATILIMGAVCTRDCLFCSVPTGIPSGLDETEDQKVWQIAELMELSYLVITSVTRDDLPDKGSGHFAEIIRLLKKNRPQMKVEVLIPDFSGESRLLDTVLQAAPDVLAHNVETVPGLYPRLNRRAEAYRHSLQILAHAKKKGGLVKTGLMVGLGETRAEVGALFGDLKAIGVDLLTIGQYLQPDKHCLPVAAYYPPVEFAELKEVAATFGFSGIEAGPFVRSSYRAEQLFKAVVN